MLHRCLAEGHSNPRFDPPRVDFGMQIVANGHGMNLNGHRNVIGQPWVNFGVLLG